MSEEYDEVSKEYWRAERAKDLFENKLRNLEQYFNSHKNYELTVQFQNLYWQKMAVENEIGRLSLVSMVCLEEMKRLNPNLSILGPDCTVFDQT